MNPISIATSKQNGGTNPATTLTADVEELDPNYLRVNNTLSETGRGFTSIEEDTHNPQNHQ